MAPPAGGWSTLLGSLSQDLPCPAPGMPKELASMIDCAAMKKVAGATSFIPRQIVAATLPRYVDLDERGLSGPVKDQQQVGACAGFAVSSVLDNVARRSQRGDVSSPLHVFTTYTGNGLETIRGRPMTAETVWPYDPSRACRFARDGSQVGSCGSYYGVSPGSAWSDPGLMNERARADASGFVRIDQFEELAEGTDPNQMAALLADGESIWVALRFYRPAWQSPEVERTGYLPYYPPESAGENHAVVLEGYRVGPYGREFVFKNSWGQGWGRNGRAIIPESMLRTHMNWGYRIRATLSSTPTDGGSPPGNAGNGLCIPGLACLPAPGNASWPSTSTGTWQLPMNPSVLQGLPVPRGF
ncbi:MAG: hypothetical protein HOW73_44655 [Polyangiaceae bacterium]|nr:hypothetical protein [Polyangiaceae bacterium]